MSLGDKADPNLKAPYHVSGVLVFVFATMLLAMSAFTPFAEQLYRNSKSERIIN